jgi:hypothetical protein
MESLAVAQNAWLSKPTALCSIRHSLETGTSISCLPESLDSPIVSRCAGTGVQLVWVPCPCTYKVKGSDTGIGILAELAPRGVTKEEVLAFNPGLNFDALTIDQVRQTSTCSCMLPFSLSYSAVVCMKSGWQSEDALKAKKPSTVGAADPDRAVPNHQQQWQLHCQPHTEAATLSSRKRGGRQLQELVTTSKRRLRKLCKLLVPW